MAINDVRCPFFPYAMLLLINLKRPSSKNLTFLSLLDTGLPKVSLLPATALTL